MLQSVATEAAVVGIMSVREFNANVSSAIARAEAGEVIEITKNNRTVAELRPRTGSRERERAEALRRMTEIMDRGFKLGGVKPTEEDKYGDADL